MPLLERTVATVIALIETCRTFKNRRTGLCGMSPLQGMRADNQKEYQT
jgi:hypothetical protein